MFTGIVQGTAPVVSIDEKSNFRTHVVKFPQELLPDLSSVRPLLTTAVV